MSSVLLCFLGERGAQIETVLIARHHNIIISYVNIRGGGRSTEETDGIESHLKLRTCANERATHWFHLHALYKSGT